MTIKTAFKQYAPCVGIVLKQDCIATVLLRFLSSPRPKFRMKIIRIDHDVNFVTITTIVDENLFCTMQKYVKRSGITIHIKHIHGKEWIEASEDAKKKQIGYEIHLELGRPIKKYNVQRETSFTYTHRAICLIKLWYSYALQLKFVTSNHNCENYIIIDHMLEWLRALIYSLALLIRYELKTISYLIIYKSNSNSSYYQTLKCWQLESKS